MKNVILYTDGACSGNPGPGGWASILRYGDSIKELSGGEKDTTNNRMELTGVIEGLKALKEPCAVELYSDSQYIVNALNNGWLRDCKKRGWKRRDGELKNAEMWQELDSLLQKHRVTAVWVRGHADNEWNNRCDALAARSAKGWREYREEKERLYTGQRAGVLFLLCPAQEAAAARSRHGGLCRGGGAGVPVRHALRAQPPAAERLI